MAVSQHTNCGLLIQFEQSCFVCVCVFFFFKGGMGKLCWAGTVGVQFESKERDQYLNDSLH